MEDLWPCVWRDRETDVPTVRYVAQALAGPGRRREASSLEAVRESVDSDTRTPRPSCRVTCQRVEFGSRSTAAAPRNLRGGARQPRRIRDEFQYQFQSSKEFPTFRFYLFI